MASNVPSRKPSNAVNNNRTAHKQLKLDMPPVSRAHQQPTSVSSNNKDSKDAGKEHSKDKKKIKTAQSKATGMSVKQSGKGIPEGVEPTRSTLSAKTQLNERQPTSVRHMELEKQVKQPRKLKMDTSATVQTTTVKNKELRATTAEVLTLSKQRKASKSPEKEAAAQRTIRNKNQSHNTKIFFDKYLKFAYDLSTPDGVRKLEAHFFPVEKSRPTGRKTPSDAGDSVDKQSLPDEKTKAKILKNNDQFLQPNSIS